MLLEDFNAKWGREFVLKSTIWNESLCENSCDNGVRVVSSVTSKIWLRARCSFIELFINTLGPLVVGRFTTRLITFW